LVIIYGSDLDFLPFELRKRCKIVFTVFLLSKFIRPSGRALPKPFYFPFKPLVSEISQVEAAVSFALKIGLLFFSSIGLRPEHCLRFD
jgi:hypothetical protein